MYNIYEIVDSVCARVVKKLKAIEYEREKKVEYERKAEAILRYLSNGGYLHWVLKGSDDRIIQELADEWFKYRYGSSLRIFTFILFDTEWEINIHIKESVKDLLTPDGHRLFPEKLDKLHEPITRTLEKFVRDNMHKDLDVNSKEYAKELSEYLQHNVKYPEWLFCLQGRYWGEATLSCSIIKGDIDEQYLRASR